MLVVYFRLSTFAALVCIILRVTSLIVFACNRYFHHVCAAGYNTENSGLSKGTPAVRCHIPDLNTINLIEFYI